MDTLRVFCDPQRLTQVISNLLRHAARGAWVPLSDIHPICPHSNACKFSPAYTGVIACTVSLSPPERDLFELASVAGTPEPGVDPESPPVYAATPDNESRWPPLPESTERQLREHVARLGSRTQWRQLRLSVRCVRFAQTNSCPSVLTS